MNLSKITPAQRETTLQMNVQRILVLSVLELRESLLAARTFSDSRMGGIAGHLSEVWIMDV